MALPQPSKSEKTIRKIDIAQVCRVSYVQQTLYHILPGLCGLEKICLTHCFGIRYPLAFKIGWVLPRSSTRMVVFRAWTRMVDRTACQEATNRPTLHPMSPTVDARPQ